MDDGSLDGMLEQLRSEESRLAEQHVAVLAEAKEIEANLQRIQGAIAALTGGKTPAKKKSSTPRAKALTTDEVAGFLVRVLKQHPVLSEARLKQAIEQAVGQAKRSKAGLHLRLAEALKQTRFEKVQDGWRIAVEPPATGPQAKATPPSPIRSAVG